MYIYIEREEGERDLHFLVDKKINLCLYLMRFFFVYIVSWSIFCLKILPLETLLFWSFGFLLAVAEDYKYLRFVCNMLLLNYNLGKLTYIVVIHNALCSQFASWRERYYPRIPFSFPLKFYFFERRIKYHKKVQGAYNTRTA